MLKADQDFFNTDIRGNVPVIVIFTKFDSVLLRSYQELRNTGMSVRDAKAARDQQMTIAKSILTKDFLGELQSPEVKFPPTAHLHVTNMHKEGHDCSHLIETTAGAITDDALKMLFVSVQQNNINLCTEYAMKRVLNMKYSNLPSIVKDSIPGYPHAWFYYDSFFFKSYYYSSLDYKDDDDDDDDDDEDDDDDDLPSSSGGSPGGVNTSD